jgi:hypothetical protein
MSGWSTGARRSSGRTWVLVQSGQAFAGLEAFLDPPALTGDRDQRGQRHPARADQQTYAKRNTVERGYLRLKQWRGTSPHGTTNTP